MKMLVIDVPAKTICKLPVTYLPLHSLHVCECFLSFFYLSVFLDQSDILMCLQDIFQLHSFMVYFYNYQLNSVLV